MKKLDRKIEVRKLKTEMKNMLEEIGISKSMFYKTLPRVSGEGYKYRIEPEGHKMSLRQQYSFLKSVVDLKNKKDEAKKEKENEKSVRDFSTI